MVAEHHGTPLGMAPSPSLLLASAAQRTRRIRLGPLVYVLPLYNPMRLAQEVCMLDQLEPRPAGAGHRAGLVAQRASESGRRSGGDAGDVPRGAGDPAHGADHRPRDVPGPVQPSSQRVRLEAEPYQRPYPPLWYPTSNPGTIPWVAENGYQLLLSFNTPTLEENHRPDSLYREALPRAASNPAA